MDRNLGALDTKYHSDGGKTGYYQFGRKDPFRANVKVWSYDQDTFAATEYTGGGRIIISRATIEEQYATGGENMPYSIMHPREFITNSGAWTDGQFNPTPYNSSIVWQDPQISNKFENEETDKSIFDPCPLGWSVPVDGWARGLIGDSSGDATGSLYVYFQWVNNIQSGSVDNANGRTYYPNGYLVDRDIPNAQKIYFPAFGCLNIASGTLYAVGVYANYWSCSPRNATYGYYLYFNSSRVTPSNADATFANGFPVRCVQK